MKSLSKFGLVLGMIALLPSQLFAGEVTHWLNENAAPIYFTSVGGGTAMFVVGGVASEHYGNKFFDAQKRLGLPEERKKLEKQVADAEHEYQTEKAKLEKIVENSPGQAKNSNVISLDAVRQRKVYAEAEAKYKNLQARYVLLEERIGREAVSSPQLIKAAEKEMKRADKIYGLSLLSQLISIPVVFVPPVALGISDHIEKAKAEKVSAGSRESDSAPSQSSNASAR